jgi:hypothetical protein
MVVALSQSFAAQVPFVYFAPTGFGIFRNRIFVIKGVVKACPENLGLSDYQNAYAQFRLRLKAARQ